MAMDTAPIPDTNQGVFRLFRVSAGDPACCCINPLPFKQRTPRATTHIWTILHSYNDADRPSYLWSCEIKSLTPLSTVGMAGKSPLMTLDPVDEISLPAVWSGWRTFLPHSLFHLYRDIELRSAKHLADVVHILSYSTVPSSPLRLTTDAADSMDLSWVSGVLMFAPTLCRADMLMHHPTRCRLVSGCPERFSMHQECIVTVYPQASGHLLLLSLAAPMVLSYCPRG